MSRLTGITYPDNSTASFTYDIRGRRITSTDQNGKTTTYTYDDADRLTAVTDPANNTTLYNYDTEDSLLSIFSTLPSTNMKELGCECEKSLGRCSFEIVTRPNRN